MPSHYFIDERNRTQPTFPEPPGPIPVQREPYALSAFEKDADWLQRNPEQNPDPTIRTAPADTVMGMVPDPSFGARSGAAKLGTGLHPKGVSNAERWMKWNKGGRKGPPPPMDEKEWLKFVQDFSDNPNMLKPGFKPGMATGLNRFRGSKRPRPDSLPPPTSGQSWHKKPLGHHPNLKQDPATGKWVDVKNIHPKDW